MSLTLEAPVWDALQKVCNDIHLLTVVVVAIIISQIILLGLICIYISISNNINKTNLRIIELFELRLSGTNIEKVEDVNSELMEFITAIFIDYRFIKRFNYDSPVNEAEETTMYQEVMNEVISKMSPALLDRILRIYNKDRIHDIIRDKTIQLVSEYCTECNRPK